MTLSSTASGTQQLTQSWKGRESNQKPPPPVPRTRPLRNNVMDNLEPQPSAQATSNDLKGQFEGLRQTVNMMLVLLVVVSGTLTIFLVRQWRFAKTDLDMLRPQAMQIINDYTRVSAPAMQDFVRKLTEYSK